MHSAATKSTKLNTTSILRPCLSVLKKKKLQMEEEERLQ